VGAMKEKGQKSAIINNILEIFDHISARAHRQKIQKSD